jgi:bifunctional DNA-binding transcriptional regulator/antitoxin component of YhaV-PrlF toxin-antitoxin module
VAGYSGTPLAKKLGIKDGSEVFLVDEPDGYLVLLEPLPEAVRFVTCLTESTDIVHIFSSQRVELQKSLTSFRPKLKPTGMIWVSWPKKSAKVPTDITEDTVREIALPLGFVDIKVCAVDEVWSGLKLVVRKELRGR